jgi:hypothetical protein
MNWKGFGRKGSLTNFKVLFQHSPGGTEKDPRKTVRITGLRAEI